MSDEQDVIEYLQRLGEVIAGRYVLGDLLGIGGMGVVYAAIQRPLGRTVAVKLPRRELASDPVVRERFHSEALAGSRVAHRNVVRVLDFGDADGTPYLVMEHVVGSRLGQIVLKHGSMSVALATAIVRQLLAGLAVAHANGIVHADVTCNNVLVETLRDGAALPRLIDFGIARFVDAPCAGCASHKLLISGTPEYLAPEVIRGESPTFASDIYAVGALLYKLVTGATPFAGGNSTEVMTRQLEDAAVPPSWRCPGGEIPAALDEVIERALSKQPAERFPDALAFAAALEQAAPSHTIARLPGPRLTGVPPAFSTQAKTVTMDGEHPRRPAHDRRSWVVEQRRDAVATATSGGDADAIVIAYLDLALALVDEHELRVAISELEQGVALVSRMTLHRPGAPVWPLALTLASFHDRVGARGRACLMTRVAYDHANRAGSALGVERALQLLTRLTGSRARQSMSP